MKRVLGLFAKQPIPGKVKTRLSETLGFEQAAALYDAFLRDTADRFRNVFEQRMLGWSGSDTGSESAAAFFESLADGDYALWQQPAGSLGFRMQSFFETAFSTGADAVVLIGTDTPSLPVRYVAQAFTELEQRDIVLGPATDGGYYLIGQSRKQASAARGVFDGISWSTSDVFLQTIERANALKLSIGVLDPWYDVDTLDDLKTLAGHLEGLAAGRKLTEEHDEIPPRTLALLQTLAASWRTP